MKIKFVPTEQQIEVRQGESVMQAAHRNGVPIRSLCKGSMICAECRVRVVKGEENMFPPSRQEIQVVGTGFHIDGRRLSCQIMCFGDVTIDIQEQLDRQEVQTKKLRGFRSQRAGETKAVVDTMILNAESLPTISAESSAESPKDQGSRSSRSGNQGGRQGGKHKNSHQKRDPRR